VSSPPVLIEQILRATSAHAFYDYNWLEDIASKHPDDAVRLFGYCTAVAIEHPAWTFWEVLHEARQKFVRRQIRA
jgi:hypothetical protein